MTELPPLDFIRGHLSAVPVHGGNDCACHDVAQYLAPLVAEVEQLRRATLVTGLTRMEAEVLDLLVATDLSYELTAKQRGVSVNTIKTQVAGVYRKTGCRNRLELRTARGAV